MTMANFFITGLPRSRTAWLANLMTYNGAFCLHEGAKLFPDKEGYVDWLRSGHAAHVGDSSSGLLKTPEILLHDFPDAPLVLIDRPVDEAEQALKDSFGVGFGEDKEQIVSAMEKLRRRSNTLIINYSSLDSLTVIKNIWFHLLTFVPFDAAPAAMLGELTVQVHEGKYMRSIIDIMATGAPHWMVTPKTGGEQCH